MMSFNPLVKTALGAVACYAAPRLASYGYRNRNQLLTPGQIQSLYNFGQKLSAPAKAVPTLFRSTAAWLQQNSEKTKWVHTTLILFHLADRKSRLISLHVFLLPWLWNDLANYVSSVPKLIKYSAEVIHDNQWICHIAFCYFFFNGQIAAKGSQLLFEYAKFSVGGAIALDLTKAVSAYLFNVTVPNRAQQQYHLFQ